MPGRIADRLGSSVARSTLVCVFLATLVWTVFGQTVRFPFINFDDPMYVAEEPHIRAGLTVSGLAWAFTHFRSTNWYPLTNLSHMLEAQWFGMNPGWFHLTNVLLHTAAAILLFFALRRLTD